MVLDIQRKVTVVAFDTRLPFDFWKDVVSLIRGKHIYRILRLCFPCGAIIMMDEAISNHN